MKTVVAIEKQIAIVSKLFGYKFDGVAYQQRKLLDDNQIALTDFLTKHVKVVTVYAKDNFNITVTRGSYKSVFTVLNHTLGFDPLMTRMDETMLSLDRR